MSCDSQADHCEFLFLFLAIYIYDMYMANMCLSVLSMDSLMMVVMKIAIP